MKLKIPENIILTREEYKNSRLQSIDKSLRGNQDSRDLDEIRGNIFLTKQISSKKTPPLKNNIQSTNAQQDSLKIIS